MRFVRLSIIYSLFIQLREKKVMLVYDVLAKPRNFVLLLKRKLSPFLQNFSLAQFLLVVVYGVSNT